MADAPPHQNGLMLRIRGAVQAFARALRGELPDGDQFRALFDTAAVGISLLDLGGRFVEVNECFGRLVGRSPRSLVGQSAARVTFPDDLPEDERQRQRLLRGELVQYTREKRYVRDDGSAVWARANVSLVRGARGEPRHFLAVVEDIDARRRAQAAEKDSEARLRIALEASNMGTWEHDLAARRNRWSAQQEALFGLAPGTFDGEHSTFLAMVHPEDREGLLASSRRAVEQRAPYRSEYRIIRADGSVRWMAGRGDVIYDAAGRPAMIVGVTMDVTHRKLAEQERAELLVREQRARAEAEAANRRKDHFLAVLSHELRTPLTPVIARLALLKRDPGITPEIESALEMIRRNVELEARLIEDLLDVTRITRGTLRLDRQRIDAHRRIRAALEIYQAEIAARHIDLRVELGAQNPFVFADPARLQQIFWNLISNAVKYTPPGRGITVSSENVDSRLRVVVRDTGIGIAPEIMERLFDPFEQGEQTLTRRYGGLGLGLSISRTLAQLHGGTLTAHSEGPDRGAEFTVELATADAVEAAPPPQPAPPSRSLRILLVEDNPDTLHVMTRLLRSSGHTVRSAASIRDALDAAEKDDFDLLISDIGLPDGSGWELMRQLRQRRPVRGIALSGFAMDEDVQKSRSVGFLAHLAKPVNPQDLEQAILRAADN